ncbi:MAG TPA: cytidylate kinase family protein [Casimicrobiaceae bacterium]|nr:cytidylate kinase family protein [Casimicrobiaceae bacterium]
MTVIAMTQEMATLGTDVAQGLAKTLGLKVVQHEVGDTVAERMELKRSLIRRVREGQAGWLEKRGIDPDVFAVYAAEEILTLAHEGNVVIRGWGATSILRGVSHIPCIRVCAPMANRVEWLMERLDSDDADLAREEIERSDAAHVARTQQNFGVNLHDPLLYDLTLNTGRVSVESCVDQVIALTRRPEFQPTDASAAQLRNLALQARIRSALKANEATADVNITTEANVGMVTLRGMVVNAKEREQTAAVIAGVDGVLGVDNQLRVMEFGRRRTTMRKF